MAGPQSEFRRHMLYSGKVLQCCLQVLQFGKIHRTFTSPLNRSRLIWNKITKIKLWNIPLWMKSQNVLSRNFSHYTVAHETLLLQYCSHKGDSISCVQSGKETDREFAHVRRWNVMCHANYEQFVPTHSAAMEYVQFWAALGSLTPPPPCPHPINQELMITSSLFPHKWRRTSNSCFALFGADQCGIYTDRCSDMTGFLCINH